MLWSLFHFGFVAHHSFQLVHSFIPSFVSLIKSSEPQIQIKKVSIMNAFSIGSGGTTWMLRLDWSLSRLVTQDIKTQPQINRVVSSWLNPRDEFMSSLISQIKSCHLLL